MEYYLLVLELARQEPIATIAVIAIAGVLTWVWGFEFGCVYGREMQHMQEMDSLCSPGENTFQVVDSKNDTWSIFVKAVLQRRGARKI